ncbi:ABC transporter substrate-binding protein [Glaciihabitans sp. UYNi722]|uniref:ABC transporter substrate-binding protein n=1 Tax=Glaciihabitans sp. UYNi722 TaxID=3156344 RepID=UPI00339082FE
MRWRSKRIMAIAAIGLSAGLVLAGCSAGGSNGTSGGGSGGGTLSIGTGGVFTDSNNPFASTSSASANGWRWLVYEPLVQTNSVDPTAKPEPWLASAYKWNTDYTKVTFTARDGVKWSDGKAFTADDIAFTFNLIKSNESLNTASIPFTSIKKSGNDVTVSFGESQFVKQAATIGQFIVPEHLWKDVSNPATFQDKAPIGTGPFLFSSASSSVAKLKKNTAYWQADKVKVGAVVYQALQGNDAILNGLAAHKLDWAGSAALNLKEGFLDKDPKRNFAWGPAVLGISAFVVNTAKAPFDDVHLRRAMSMVIDRKKIVKLASNGQTPVVKSVAGLPQPVGDSFIDPSLKGKDVSIDLAGAKAELTKGGFSLDGGVLKDASGKAVIMTLIDPTGWTDYLTALQVISDNFGQIGIKTTTETPSQDAWQAALSSGNFDGTMRYSNSGPTPYDIYSSYADGSLFAPIGSPVTGNYGRYNNPAVTSALKQYATASSDNDRTAAMKTIQEAWTTDVPAISIWANPANAMFTTVNFTGWPSADDPYASPGILSSSVSKIMVTLKPAK